MYKYLMISLIALSACSKNPYHDSTFICFTAFGTLKAEAGSVKYLDKQVVTIDEGLDEVTLPLSTCVAVRDK